jgi:hypothetical protein
MVSRTRQSRPAHGLRQLAAALAAALPLLAPAAPPVLDAGAPGAFDAARVAGPVVRREADGSWRLWYTGSAAGDGTADGRTGRIGLARSADGRAWTRVPGEGFGGAILEPTPDPDRFDTGHIAVSDVAGDASRLVLWYVGGRADATLATGGRRVRGWPLAAVRAISTDGERFQRDTGPSAGALLAPGDAALGSPASIGWPQVVATGPRRFLLYYHSPDAAGRATVFVGSSRDGRSFAGAGTALGPGAAGDFDADGVGARHVVAHGDGFLMVYEGQSRGLPTGIGLARSGDGRRFTRVRGPLPGGAILLPDRDRQAWDGGHVGQPWLVPLPDGRFRLYYSGAPRNRGWSRGAPAWRIGMAESGPTLMDFRRP